jgi:hypothetical protein
MLHTFTDSLMPDPSKPTLVSTVFAGDVFDNSTGVKVRGVAAKAGSYHA